MKVLSVFTAIKLVFKKMLKLLKNGFVKNAFE